MHPRYFVRGSNLSVAVVVSAASCFVFVALTRCPGQGKVPVGGQFTLVDDGGTPVTESIGYTFCPDVCPTTLLDLSRWIQNSGRMPTSSTMSS
jgi:cytochrome oxidase Cu insertion factor (SCO1/SenC/PrrC family)